MANNMHRLSAFIQANFGHCTRCIRQSALFAACAWAVVALIAVFAASPLLLTLAGIGAVALTALWTAHVLAYAVRASWGKTDGNVVLPDLSRRAMFPAFARALGVAAVGSALPRLGFAAQTKFECLSQCDSSRDACLGGCKHSACKTGCTNEASRASA